MNTIMADAAPKLLNKLKSNEYTCDINNNSKSMFGKSVSVEEMFNVLFN